MKQNRTGAFEKAATAQKERRYVLRLYVAGVTPKSSLAIESVRQVCEARLGTGYELTVIDIRREPAVAVADQIIATPTLVRKEPLPLRRLIGSMINEERIIAGLALPAPEKRRTP